MILRAVLAVAVVALAVADTDRFKQSKSTILGRLAAAEEQGEGPGLLPSHSGSATGPAERQDGISKLEPETKPDLTPDASFWGYRPQYHHHGFLRPRYYALPYGLPYAHPYLGPAHPYGYGGIGHLGPYPYIGHGYY